MSPVTGQPAPSHEGLEEPNLIAMGRREGRGLVFHDDADVVGDAGSGPHGLVGTGLGILKQKKNI